jgi:hypothetical protein
MDIEMIIGLVVVIAAIGFVIYRRNRTSNSSGTGNPGGGLERDSNTNTVEK